MKIDFSLEVSKKCCKTKMNNIYEHISCRKSYKIHSGENIKHIRSYVPNISSTTGGVKSDNCCVACIVLSIVFCCVLSPALGLCIGQIFFFIGLLTGQNSYYTPSSTMYPTMYPTLYPTYYNYSNTNISKIINI